LIFRGFGWFPTSRVENERALYKLGGALTSHAAAQ
jgi:hypothetical protein